MSVLASKVIIVTGAARGLGRTMARGLVQAGARVVGVDLPGESELAAVAADLGSRFAAVHADITDEAHCSAVVDAAYRHFNGLHVLVNNAGIGMQFINPQFASNPTPFWGLTPAQWRQGLEVNATAQFLMARACAPGMIGQGWGRIINLTTSFSTMLRRGFSPYGPSKAAAEAATAIWAQDLATTGVSVNALLPGGAADTRMITDTVVFADRSTLVQPARMVPPVVWLSSDASDGVTGMRFIADRWDTQLDPAAAAALASAPAAW